MTYEKSLRRLDEIMAQLESEQVGLDASLKLFEEGQTGRTIALTGPDGYVLELQHLIEAIRTGVRPEVVTPEDGLSAVEICEAEEKSVNLRQIVSL